MINAGLKRLDTERERKLIPQLVTIFLLFSTAGHLIAVNGGGCEFCLLVDDDEDDEMISWQYNEVHLM